MDSALNTNLADRTSTARGNMHGSSSSEFEVIGTSDRGGDGWLEDIKLPHTRYDAPVVNDKGLYKRIMIKRKAAE